MQLVELSQFAGISRRLLVHQKSAVGAHSAHQQRFLESEQIHFRQVFFIDNGLDYLAVAFLQIQLFLGGRDSQNLGGARGQLFDDPFAGAAQQQRFEVCPQFIQVLVTQQLSFFIDHLMPVEKPEGRPQPAVVDEFHHRKKLVEPVFKRCPRQHQGKRRFQGFDHPARFGLPVFNALRLVEDNQVPFDPLDGQKIAQHLLVVAYGEKTVACHIAPDDLWRCPAQVGSCDR